MARAAARAPPRPVGRDERGHRFVLRVVVEFRDERAQAAVVLSEEGGDRLPLAARQRFCVGHLRVAAERDECRRDLLRGWRAAGSVAAHLAAEAVARGNNDNCSVVVVEFVWGAEG